MTRIEALLLDADGVIQDIDDFPTRMDALLQGKAAFPEVLKVETRAITGHTDLAAELGAFLRERGITSTPEDLFAVWNSTKSLPGVLELIDRVRATGIRVYLATNQQPVRGLFIQENLGYSLHFDGEFYSFEMGIAKPSPDFYRMICEALGLDPETALFVDDLAPNIAGAREAGLHAAQLPRQAAAPEEPVGEPAGVEALEALLRENGITPVPPATPGAPPIRTVLLDADGVVQRNREFRPYLARVLAGRASVEDVYAIERQCLTGEHDVRDLVGAFLAERGMGHLTEEILTTWAHSYVIPGVPEVVAGARAAGVKVYLATNQRRDRGEVMQAEMGYDKVFDGGFYSYEMGVAKPDAAFFHPIVDSLGVDPATVLFVDDFPENVEAAAAAGLQAAWLHRDAGARGLAALFRIHGVPTS